MLRLRTVLSVLSGSNFLKNVRVGRYENLFISFLEAIKNARSAQKKQKTKTTTKKKTKTKQNKKKKTTKKKNNKKIKK